MKLKSVFSLKTWSQRAHEKRETNYGQFKRRLGDINFDLKSYLTSQKGKDGLMQEKVELVRKNPSFNRRFHAEKEKRQRELDEYFQGRMGALGVN